MIVKFSHFIKEELKVSQINNRTLLVLKQNIKDKLIEYKTYLLTNIEVVNNMTIYRDFDRIDKRIIIRELRNEFTQEFIEELKLDKFIENLDIIYSDRNDIMIKKKIRNLFREYFLYLNSVEK